MSDWDGTSDQYQMNDDSRYPLFSDMQTTDYSITTVPKPVQPHQARSFESKYQYEQQGIPAVISCRCGACPMAAPRPPRPLHRLSMDEREAIIQLQHDAIFGRAYRRPEQPSAVVQPTAVVQPSTSFTYPSTINLDSTSIILMFIFFIVIIVCVACMRSIRDLQHTIAMLTSKQGAHEHNYT